MTTFLFDYDVPMARWAAKRIAHIQRPENFGQCRTIGIATGQSSDDTLLAVVVFHGLNQMLGTVQISAASVNPRWARKEVFREILAFPFKDMGCNKVWAAVPHTHLRTHRLMSHIGFVKEGTQRDQFGLKTHAVNFGMTAHDYDRRYPKRADHIEAPAFVQVTARELEAA